MVQRFLPLASTDRDCLHVLARSCYRHPGALAESARQRLTILLARPLPSYALAAMLKHAHRGPPITGGVEGSGNGHERINASPAAYYVSIGAKWQPLRCQSTLAGNSFTLGE